MDTGQQYDALAPLYEDARPGYPAPLFEDVLEYCQLPSDSRILEVGAGTGKATIPFLSRGYQVVALEPSSGMADALGHRLKQWPSVKIVRERFEDFDAEGATFPLLTSATAWHWIRRDIRATKAHSTLDPNGTLALFWHRPVMPLDVRYELDKAYQIHARDLRSREPSATPPPPHLLGHVELEASGMFDDVTASQYEWVEIYDADRYTNLLDTEFGHRSLSDEARQELYAAISDIIALHGDRIEIPHVADLALARRK